MGMVRASLFGFILYLASRISFWYGLGRSDGPIYIFIVVDDVDVVITHLVFCPMATKDGGNIGTKGQRKSGKTKDRAGQGRIGRRSHRQMLGHRFEAHRTKRDKRYGILRSSRT